MGAYRQLPRGVPAIGFELTTELELTPVGHVVRCSERHDGRTVGELEVEVFAASLVIDRDGILEAKASDRTGGNPAVKVSLPGASGFRAEGIAQAPLRYLYVFAMAPRDGIDGGILVTVRCARPDWPAAEAVLRSLRILTRHGVAANDEQLDDAPLLPLVDS
jgi:hypothetical protein